MRAVLPVLLSLLSAFLLLPPFAAYAAMIKIWLGVEHFQDCYNQLAAQPDVTQMDPDPPSFIRFQPGATAFLSQANNQVRAATQQQNPNQSFHMVWVLDQ